MAIKLVVSKGAKGDSIEWKGEWSPTVVYDSVHVVSRGGRRGLVNKVQT